MLVLHTLGAYFIPKKFITLKFYYQTITSPVTALARYKVHPHPHTAVSKTTLPSSCLMEYHTAQGGSQGFRQQQDTEHFQVN